jgi:hypothetical protein
VKKRQVPFILYSFHKLKKKELVMKKSTKSRKIIPASLSQLNPKCAGIDVGASELFVCIAKTSSKQEVRSFSTFTSDLTINRRRR